MPETKVRLEVEQTFSQEEYERLQRRRIPQQMEDKWFIYFDLSMARRSVRQMVLRLYRSINPRDFVNWEGRLLAFTSQVPTLVLWGDQDPFISPAYAERFGAARVEHFPENGHWLATEAPNEVAQRLEAFFHFNADTIRSTSDSQG